MKSIRIFHAVARGESHKIKNTPCQDAANTIENRDNGVFLGAVSDGHGSPQYFRSDRGSGLLVKIAMDTISEFIQMQDKTMLTVPFTAFPDQNVEKQEQAIQKPTPQHTAFRRLFAAIITKWNDAIYDDWQNDTPSIEQMKAANVPDDYIKLFQAGNEIEMAYGCTLIAFAQSPEYWFALQLGDGKCIAFDNEARSFEPIPWDEKCKGNTTTSICENTALENFRYCYGNDRRPVALFIGSDGMDGAYGAVDEFAVPLLTGLYENIIKSFVHNGYDTTVAEIEEMLPKLSEQGVTRDDMSLAGWIDMARAATILPVLLKKKIEETKSKILETEETLRAKTDAKKSLVKQIEQKQTHIEKKTRETQNAEKELNRALKAYREAEKKKKQAESQQDKVKLETENLTIQIQNLNRESELADAEIGKTEKIKEKLTKKLAELNNELGAPDKENIDKTDKKGFEFGP